MTIPVSPSTAEEGSRLLLQTLAKAAVPLFRPGTKVRLRNCPDETGVVLSTRCSLPGDVKVRWDSDAAFTYIASRQLEVMR